MIWYRNLFGFSSSYLFEVRESGYVIILDFELCQISLKCGGGSRLSGGGPDLTQKLGSVGDQQDVATFYF